MIEARLQAIENRCKSLERGQETTNTLLGFVIEELKLQGARQGTKVKFPNVRKK